MPNEYCGWSPSCGGEISYTDEEFQDKDFRLAKRKSLGWKVFTISSWEPKDHHWCCTSCTKKLEEEMQRKKVVKND